MGFSSLKNIKIILLLSMRYNMKKTSLILILILLTNLFSACGESTAVKNADPVMDPLRYETLKSRGLKLYVGLLYDSAIKKAEDLEYLSRLKQSRNLGLKYFTLDINEEISYEDFNILFLDDSLLKSPGAADIIKKCFSFSEAGGFVYAENAFLPLYDKHSSMSFSVSELKNLPAFDSVSFPSVPEDMEEMQEILSDYLGLYLSYGEALKEERRDCGYVIKNGKSLIPISFFDGGILSAVVPTGSGATLFLPAALPDKLSRQDSDLKTLKTGREYYSDTSLSAARLMEDAFMAFASRSALGFSLERNLGPYTRPSISVSLPLDVPVVRRGAQIDLISRASKLGIVPSYSVADSTYMEGGPFCVFSYLESKKNLIDFVNTELDSNGLSGKRIKSGNELLALRPAKSVPTDVDSRSRLENAACSISCVHFNSDKSPDFLIGSSNGDIKLSMGNLSDEKSYVLGPPFTLKSDKFEELRVPGPSAPTGCDINFDGFLDILCGTGDGRVLWFEGYNGTSFRPRGELLTIPDGGRIIPTTGDLNGDRYPDMLLSTESGRLLIYFGMPRGGFSEEFEEIELPGYCGKRLSPLIYDINGDKRQDILLGTEEGYILKLLQNEDGSFSQAGPIEAEFKNKFGENRVYFGGFVSPAVADLNFDGKPDIVTASAVNNFSVPLDTLSAASLNLIVKSASDLKNKDYYIGLRPTLGSCSETQDEVFRIDNLLKRIKNRVDFGDAPFGIEVFGRQINAFCPERSLSSVVQSKASWLSAYDKPDLPENALALPYYFTRSGRALLLVQNSAEKIEGSDFSRLSAKYELPLKLSLDGTDVDGSFELLEQAAKFKSENFYTSLMENQLVFALNAALNFELSLDGDAPAYSKDSELLLIPKHLSDENPLYSANYSGAVGAVITFSAALGNRNFGTDADIYYKDGNKLYFSLSRAVRIYEQKNDYEQDHLLAVNLPCKIEKRGENLEIVFSEPGFKELVYKGKARVLTQGWSSFEKDGCTYFRSDSSLNRVSLKPIGG